MYCNPDKCPHCQYIGEGDSWCDELHEIVLSDWEPTEHYMGPGCPYLAQPRRRKRRRKKKGPDAGTVVKYAILTLLGIWLTASALTMPMPSAATSRWVARSWLSCSPTSTGL